MTSVHAFAASFAEERLDCEHILTSPEWMGLDTATPAQRAVCRMSDGLPIDDLLKLPLVEGLDAYPDEVKERATWAHSIPGGYTPGAPPLELYFASAIRSAKSTMSIAKALQMSQTADLSMLMEGEIARFGIVSLTIKNAQATFRKIVAAFNKSPAIRARALSAPTDSRLMLRHPSGHPIEIIVLAGKRGGGSLVSEWLIGAVFDEATRMLSSEDGVVNVDEGRKAAKERLLPGCQLWFVGSPWAPMGLVYNQVKAAEDGELAPGDVVVRAIGPALNPTWWDAERIWRLVQSPKQSDQEVLMTDGLAEFVDVESSWFLGEQLRAISRKEPLKLPREHGVHYFASMDPATKTNAWTVAIAGMARDGKRKVFAVQEWLPKKGAPLRAKVVLPEIKALCDEYGIVSVATDQHGDTLLAEIGDESDLFIHSEHITRAKKVERFRTLRELVNAGDLELPAAPNVIDDLKRVRRRLTSDGVNVVFPKTSDGRHCDYAPAIADAVFRATLEADPDEEPETKIQVAQRRAAEQVRQHHLSWDAADDFAHFDEVEFE